MDKIEEYLRRGKKALQILVKSINVIHQTGITVPNFKKLYNKLLNEDDKSHLGLEIKNDHDIWLKEFLDARDASEHPETMLPKGQKLYEDFDVSWSEQKKKWVIDMPRMYFGAGVENFLKGSMYNLFTFCEDIHVLLIKDRLIAGTRIVKLNEKQMAERGGRNYIIQMIRN